MQPVVPLVVTLVLLPAVCAGFCLPRGGDRIRPAFVAAACAAVAVAALMLLQLGQGDFTPTSRLWAPLVAAGDFTLLAFFVIVGLLRRQFPVVLLALAQAAGLAWLEVAMPHAVEAGPTFAVDWLAVTMVLVVSLVGPIVALYAIPYMADHEKHGPQVDGPAAAAPGARSPRFFAAMLLFLGAMNGLVLANNLLWLYFFWEITTLCCFLLIGHDGTPQAAESAWRALWMNLVGGLAFVGAIVLLAGAGHPLTLRALAAAGPAPAALLAPLALLCVAGFTKAAQMPFQGWLLGAMVAPTPVSALLHSSTMVKAGVYLILRLSPALHGTRLSLLVALVGAFSFVTAAMLAISQTNAKRVLAYSTISNLGLIIACAGLNTAMALSAALLLVIFHAVSKALLFMTAGVIEQAIGSRQIEDMEGLSARLPLTTAATVVGILSMLLPPFGMLIAKWAALEAAAQSPPALLLFVAGSAFTVVFWTKWLGRLVSVSSATPPHREALHPLYRAALGATAFAAIALSLLVAPLTNGLVLPAVRAWHAGVGLLAPSLTVGSAAGDFPVGLVFAAVLAALAVPIVWMRVHPPALAVPYACGEQVPASGRLRFRSARDETPEVSLGGFYLDGLFGEARHTVWINAVAVTLLLLILIETAWRIPS